MHFLQATLVGVLLAPALAAPAPSVQVSHRSVLNLRNETGGEAGGEAEGEENEIEQQGEFGASIALQGGDVKQDTLFPPGTNGVFEVEFQNAEGRTLTVTENTAPAAPPAGFTALEPSSYIIDLAEGADNLTLSKVDWILNEGNTLDISQGQIGRFCTEAGAFVIDPAIGELEFEAEENELTLTVANMIGEWGIFLPDAAGTGAGEAAEGSAGGEADATTGSSILDAILTLLRGN